MKKYKALILDLDGCVYVGRRLINGSREALNLFRRRGLKILFLTNNSTLTSEDYALKLKQMGIDSSPEEILTSGEATSLYILKISGPSKILPITEKGFIEYCRRVDHKILSIEEWKEAQYVVVGLDRDFNYSKLKYAARAIMNGASFLATNTDSTIPSEDGLDPGAGSIVLALRTVVKVDPIVIGKPSRIIMDLALERLKTKTSEMLVVGDRVETDIVAGKNIGADTALVLSGATRREDLERIPPQEKPDYIVENLMKLYDQLYEKGLI
ncbi:MAG: HAD-IIA family hydrolase [Aigarchaeota archaeon]|nr:HAD-IIA family hydrolase [Aigarchaeota archaeon]